MYSHASIIDGTRLCNAKVKFFKHNDMKHLETILKKIRDKFNGVLIVTDGVFSMDGDICKLPDLINLKNKYNARLMIDEAHAVGIIGKNGKGTEDHFNLINKVDIITGTLSKAPASLGGYVTGSEALIEYLRHFSNSYIFSTSLPPSIVGGLIKCFEIMENDSTRRKNLFYIQQYLIKRLCEEKFKVGSTETPIIPIIIGDDQITNKICHDLSRQGILVSPVVFPAVRKTQSRLRISLICSHTKDDIDYLIKQLVHLKKIYKI